MHYRAKCLILVSRNDTESNEKQNHGQRGMLRSENRHDYCVDRSFSTDAKRHWEDDFHQVREVHLFSVLISPFRKKV